MNTTKNFSANTKDNATFAALLGVAAIALVTLFANNVNANTHVATEVQTLDTIVVTAPRIHTVQFETIVVTASRNINNDAIVVAAK